MVEKRADSGGKISPSLRNEHFPVVSVLLLYLRTNYRVAHQSIPWPVTHRNGQRNDPCIAQNVFQCQSILSIFVKRF